MKDIPGPGPINPMPWSLLPVGPKPCSGSDVHELLQAVYQYRETRVRSDLLRHARMCEWCGAIVDGIQETLDRLAVEKLSKPPST